MKLILIPLLLTGCTQTVSEIRYLDRPRANLVYPVEYYNKIYPRIDMPSCEKLNEDIKAGKINPEENLPCMKNKAYAIVAGKIKAQKDVIGQCENILKP